MKAATAGNNQLSIRDDESMQQEHSAHRWKGIHEGSQPNGNQQLPGERSTFAVSKR